MYRLAALLEGLLQAPRHQAQPVAVDKRLVLGVHGRDGVFAILDRGDGRLEQHVLDPGWMCGADIVGAVDLDLDVQAVVAQNHGRRFARRIAREADELRGISEANFAVGGDDPQVVAIALVHDSVCGGIAVTRTIEGNDGVKFAASVFDDSFAACRVVARALLASRRLGDDVGAVEGVVQTAPTCVGGVQRETGVHHRHDKLRAGRVGDLVVHIGRGDLEGDHPPARDSRSR